MQTGFEGESLSCQALVMGGMGNIFRSCNKKKFPNQNEFPIINDIG